MAKGPEQSTPPLFLDSAVQPHYRRLTQEAKDSRSKREQQQVGERIGEQVTRGGTSALEALQGMIMGRWYEEHGQEILGRTLLDTMATYWSEAPVTYKFLFPMEMPVDVRVAQMELALQSWQQYQRGAKAEKLERQHGIVLMNIIQAFEEMKRHQDTQGVMAMRFADWYVLSPVERSLYERRMKQQLHAFLAADAMYKLPVTSWERVSTPEKLRDIAQTTSLIDGQGTLLDLRDGQLRWRDLFLFDDHERNALGMLSLMAARRRGDVLWNTLLTSAFWNIPTTASLRPENPVVADSAYSERIYMAQYWTANQFFLPLIGKDTHPQFDALIKEVLRDMPANKSYELGSIVYLGMLHGWNTLHVIAPDRVQQLLRTLPFHHYLITTHAERYPYARHVFIDELATQFFSERRDEIIQNLQQRFPGIPAIEQLIRFIAATDHRTYQVEHSEAMLDILHQVVGHGFLEKTAQRESELREMNEVLWKETRIDGLAVGYELAKNVQNVVHFEEGTLPEVMGIEYVSYIRSNDGSIYYQIAIKRAQMMVDGIMDGNTGVQLHSSFQLEEPHRAIETLLYFIVQAGYHDLILQRRDHTFASRAIDVKKPPGYRARKLTPVEIRSTPRAMISDLSDQPSLSQDGYQAKELEKRTNAAREQLGQRVYEVDMQVVPLPHSRRYKAAVEAFRQASEQDIEIRRTEVEEARRALYRPSEDKLRTLPTRFALEYIQDPLTGEQVCVTTWRVGYKVPPEGQTMAQAYRRDFAGGSALTFANHLVAWIVG